MNIQEILLDDLREYENNPRNNDGAVDAVAESIKEFGFKVPIIIDRDSVIVAGHTRLKAARRLGLETVPCIIADDLTPEQIKAYRLADNKTSELADWDFEKLEKELSELQAFDMDSFGFENLPDFFSDDCEEYAEEENEAAAGLEEPTTQQGEIWRLGKHRLICGDSTSVKDIEKLMGGEKADLLLTDPPYNVAVENSDGLTIQNDSMNTDEFLSFLSAAFFSADNVMKEGAAFYIWHGETEGLNFRKACTSVGWNIKQCLIWIKNAITLGRQDYQWKHEPCLYGWKSGTHFFIKNRRQSTVIDDDINLEMLSEKELQELINELIEPSSIIREDKPLRNKEHPTIKPLNLIKRQIRNSTRKNDIVLDLFGGSGTTLIACEELKRVCYICELDPKFCDVIIKRWETLTGETAVKLD